MNSVTEMTESYTRSWSSLARVVLFVAAFTVSSSGLAQTTTATPSGPPAAAPENIRAFAGVWRKVTSGRGVVPAKDSISLKPAYEARRAELERRLGREVIEGRNSKCIPDGMPDMMEMGFRLEVNAEYMTMIGGNGPTIRLIWLNRPEHTPDNLLFPTYGGEAIAHWEEDTLVIDTIGLNSGNELSYGLAADDDQLHIVERWMLISPSDLEVITTIESPAALVEPWTYKITYARQPVTGGITYCDSPVINYNTLDLTPPKGGYIPPGAEE